jgi:hypothetical protein
LTELADPGPKPWMVRITREEIERLSPETLAFLEYRSPRDQAILRKMSAGRPTLGGTVPGSWGVRTVSRLTHVFVYDSSLDTDLFTDPGTSRLYTPGSVLGSEPADFAETLARMRAAGFCPLFEGKHIDQFLVGVKAVRWWLSVAQAKAKYGREPRTTPTLVFRDTACNTNERTCIAAVLPVASTGSNTLAGVVFDHVSPDAAAAVLNSLVFDWALRLRTAGTHVSFTYILPVPVPTASVVNRLPRVPTRLAWTQPVSHISDDRSLWSDLWAANRAVAEAYGLGPDDFAHILASFPVFARKRPAFFAYLRDRLEEWRGELAQ